MRKEGYLKLFEREKIYKDRVEEKFMAMKFQRRMQRISKIEQDIFNLDKELETLFVDDGSSYESLSPRTDGLTIDLMNLYLRAMAEFSISEEEIEKMAEGYNYTKEEREIVIRAIIESDKEMYNEFNVIFQKHMLSQRN